MIQTSRPECDRPPVAGPVEGERETAVRVEDRVVASGAFGPVSPDAAGAHGAAVFHPGEGRAAGPVLAD